MGFIDSYRYLFPDTINFTWWNLKIHAREKGAGWRIDYILVSKELISSVTQIEIKDQIKGSDHCPVEAIINTEKIDMKTIR